MVQNNDRKHTALLRMTRAANSRAHYHRFLEAVVITDNRFRKDAARTLPIVTGGRGLQIAECNETLRKTKFPTVLRFPRSITPYFQRWLPRLLTLQDTGVGSSGYFLAMISLSLPLPSDEMCKPL